MERYANHGGDSGVRAYSITADGIEVLFDDGWAYLYTYPRIAFDALREMGKRARAGQGLNTYINQRVREHFTSKRYVGVR